MSLRREAGTESAEVDQAHFRQVLGRVPTGVVVVTSIDAEGPVGMTIGSFFSVSLEPPLVGFCVGRRSTTWPRIAARGELAVNVLADDQSDLAVRFASSHDDRFGGVGWSAGPAGPPRLHGATAVITCRVREEVGAGDHLIVLAEVLELDVPREAAPLVFYRSSYGIPPASTAGPDGPPR
ncbi:MAG: flavin reductase family protein [Acidimicrobiia bacterium]